MSVPMTLSKEGVEISAARQLFRLPRLVGAAGNFTAAYDVAPDGRAFLWENGSMIDLNSLIPPDSPLELVAANDINDRQEIAGEGVPQGVEPSNVFTQGHAFLLIPVCADGTEGCANAPLDPVVVAQSRVASGTALKTMTAEELATFKEKMARMAGRNRGFRLWPRR